MLAWLGKGNHIIELKPTGNVETDEAMLDDVMDNNPEFEMIVETE
jgi:hypothetical protein